MPRGGPRSGAPGKNYGNRSDMQMAPRQPPVMRVPGQPYGAQAEQVRSQQAVPAGPQPGVGTAPPGAPAATASPTQLIPLDAPTMRPDEPVTAGAPLGPGPGPAPEADPFANPQLPERLIQSLEMLAGLPNASDSTRNLVRRLRSRL